MVIAKQGPSNPQRGNPVRDEMRLRGNNADAPWQSDSFKDAPKTDRSVGNPKVAGGPSAPPGIQPVAQHSPVAECPNVRIRERRFV
jgi:hypothetical protein